MHQQNRQHVWTFVLILISHLIALVLLIDLGKSHHESATSAPTKLMNTIVISKQKNIPIEKSQQAGPAQKQAPAVRLKNTTPTSDISAKAEKAQLVETAKPSIDITQQMDALATAPSEPAKSINFRDQAKLIAKEMASEMDARNPSPPPLSGDYYGTYDGDDTGSFYFHLDKNGNVLGSGTSRIARSNFSISGKITSDGVIQLLGKGLAGTASFDGKIHAKTGAVSGTWYLAKFGRGKFTGKRE